MIRSKLNELLIETTNFFSRFKEQNSCLTLIIQIEKTIKNKLVDKRIYYRNISVKIFSWMKFEQIELKTQWIQQFHMKKY